MKTNPETETLYEIVVSHPREITEWEDLKIDILISLTDEEFELMKMQQLQINESKMLAEWWAKTISYSHMIENIIKEVINGQLAPDTKILVRNADESDAIVLQKWMEQLLDLTEKHILSNKK